ncbi:MAG: hypothetical protein A3F76_06340 [Burkholderiales bacterium RIFCSPLOWO2_12_FULL_65_40]|nr:MAG: hypothetical protein A3F76_06340 [Burkholderiales bacterium RIFCSPLOWO2_12_FULL_65_40]
MPSTSSGPRFLGVDFHALWREVRKSWRGAHQWPVLAWLSPAVRVRLLQADEGESLWIGEVEQPKGTRLHQTRFCALELPEHIVLRRHLSVPTMGESDTASAVALDVRSSSPFAADDLAWGYHAGEARNGLRPVDVVLVSRKQVGMYIISQSTRLEGVLAPEIWVRGADGAPIVLNGYGDNQRVAFVRRWRLVNYGLLILIVLLSVAIAITPTAQLRLRAIEAVRSYDAIAQRTVPLVKQRETLLLSVEQLGSLAEVLADRIEPLRILNQLTQALPDDTSVQSFKLQGAKLTIIGLTANASALMQLLGDQPGLRDVRAPSAATRIPGALKESYVIEFTLDPQFYGVVSVAEPQVGPKPLEAPAAKSEDVAAQASVSASSPAQAPIPVVPGGSALGGSAVYGENSARPATPKKTAELMSGAMPSASAPVVKTAP